MVYFFGGYKYKSLFETKKYFILFQIPVA